MLYDWGSLSAAALHGCPGWGACLQHCCFLETLGCCTAEMWPPDVSLQALVALVTLHLPLSASCLDSQLSVLVRGQGKFVPHRAKVKGHRMEKGGLLVELDPARSLIYRSK